MNTNYESNSQILKLLLEVLDDEAQGGQDDQELVAKEPVQGIKDMRINLLKVRLRGIHFRRQFTGDMYFKFTPRLVHL